MLYKSRLTYYTTEKCWMETLCRAAYKSLMKMAAAFNPAHYTFTK